MQTNIKLAATGVLGLFYLAVLAIAFNPHVSREYRVHYLHRTADCWVPAALRSKARDPVPPEQFSIAQMGYPEACRYLRRYWFKIEPWGVWATGRRAVLRLPERPGARAIALTLRAGGPPNPPTKVLFIFNGQTTAATIPAGATQVVTLPLPAPGAPYDPHIRLVFPTHAVVPSQPPHPGQRNVGVGLISVQYLPAMPGGTKPP